MRFTAALNSSSWNCDSAWSSTSARRVVDEAVGDRLARIVLDADRQRGEHGARDRELPSRSCCRRRPTSCRCARTSSRRACASRRRAPPPLDGIVVRVDRRLHGAVGALRVRLVRGIEELPVGRRGADRASPGTIPVVGPSPPPTPVPSRVRRPASRRQLAPSASGRHDARSARASARRAVAPARSPCAGVRRRRPAERTGGGRTATYVISLASAARLDADPSSNTMS